MNMPATLIGGIITTVRLMMTLTTANPVAPRILAVEHLNGQRNTVVGGRLENVKLSRMQQLAMPNL